MNYVIQMLNHVTVSSVWYFIEEMMITHLGFYGMFAMKGGITSAEYIKSFVYRMFRIYRVQRKMVTYKSMIVLQLLHLEN